MLRLIIIAFFISVHFLIFITCKGTYSISAPGIIHSNRKYTVCVTLHDVLESATLRIGIRSNSSWYNTQTVSLMPFETKILDFYPPKLDNGEKYELFAQGVKGLSFRNSAKLLVGTKNGANVYIETDKGIYKPGDLLRFRVVILNEHARIMHIIEPIKVQIFDGDNNRIKQFKDIRLKKGIYTNEFQISKDPVLGMWLIKVIIGGKYALQQEVSFLVEKYVLPKFKTYIETDTNFVEEDRIMKIQIYGRYTYDKYVQGNVTLKLTQLGNANNLPEFSSDITDYLAKFVIDFNSFKNLLTEKPLIVTASITEKHTSSVQSTKTEIKIRKQRYTFKIFDDEIEFLSESVQRIGVKVMYWNGSVVQEPNSNIFMTYESKRYVAELDDNGKATFEYEFIESASTYLFEYKNSSQYITNFLPYIQRNHAKFSVCNLKINNRRPKLNSELEILVESKEPLKYLVYTLTSHGNIQKHEIVNFATNQSSYKINLMCTNEMVPHSFLYVHYMQGDNLIFCETKIELPRELENKLTITAPSKVQPGEEISITINAQPGSHVAFVAVDLSTLLYSEAHRIDKQAIISEMEYDLSYVNIYSPNIPATISGLVILTDGHFDKPNLEDTLHSGGINILSGEKFAFSKIPNVDNVFKAQRSYFPETWIFSDFEITKAVSNINFKVPDSITTWVLKAFSINEINGIGFMDSALDIIVSKEFFISTYLPYSIKLGEIVSIPVVLFNYHTEILETKVIMHNSLKEFTFVNDINNETINSLSKTLNIIVPANGGKSVRFLIYPIKLGEIDIRIEAKNKLATDSVLHKLTVEPDGLALMHNHELYVQLKPGENFNTYYKTNIPPNIADDSVFLQLSISGNILLPTFENLDDLVNKPTGCGEQNMIHFAPNILVLEYLSATGQNSNYKNLVTKAKKYIELGYQQQLKFRHKSNGYSVFAQSPSTSNWLTAYVVRFFIKAVKYFPILPDNIEKSLNFLAKEQLSNGEFANTGYLFHPSHQSRYGFTAFILLTFLENPRYAQKYKGVIENALKFLSDNINEVNDIYSLAIMATAFQMAKHQNAAIILDKIKPLSKTQDDLEWWEDTEHGRTTDIEITSYVLLALLHTPGHYLPIAKWLLKQRNNHGGFKSTQDTVVGLQALVKFAQISSTQNDTLLKVSYKGLDIQNEIVEHKTLGLDPNTVKILQQYQLHSATRSIDLEITGTGSIFLQFTYQYRQSKIKGPSPLQQNIKLKSFVIQAKAKMTDNHLTMTLELNIRYTPLKDVQSLKTNMIIADIELPTGFIINNENIEELRENEDIERIDNDKPNKIILYFSHMKANEEKLINLLVDKKDEIQNFQPSMIVVYDYYHSERQEMITYEIESS